MPASYFHQSVASDCADALALFSAPELRAAMRAGSEGPDPLFFSILPVSSGAYPPAVGSMLHTKHTDDFLLALLSACKGSELLRAYCCGFFTHYATDTTCHPFVYAHSVSSDGHMSSTLHCTLEHGMETLLYRRRGNPVGLPVQFGGYAELNPSQKDEIAAALHSAIHAVFPETDISVARVRKSFDDAVNLCALLRSSGGKKYAAFGRIASLLGKKAELYSHMMPPEPPKADIANNTHAPWASVWLPDITRTESFTDLFTASKERACELVSAALAFMDGKMTEEALRALHGGLSYDSALPWQESKTPEEALAAMLKMQAE